MVRGCLTMLSATAFRALSASAGCWTHRRSANSSTAPTIRFRCRCHAVTDVVTWRGDAPGEVLEARPHRQRTKPRRRWPTHGYWAYLLATWSTKVDRSSCRETREAGSNSSRRFARLSPTVGRCGPGRFRMRRPPPGTSTRRSWLPAPLNDRRPVIQRDFIRKISRRSLSPSQDVAL